MSRKLIFLIIVMSLMLSGCVNNEEARRKDKELIGYKEEERIEYSGTVVDIKEIQRKSGGIRYLEFYVVIETKEDNREVLEVPNWSFDENYIKVIVGDAIKVSRLYMKKGDKKELVSESVDIINITKENKE